MNIQVGRRTYTSSTAMHMTNLAFTIRHYWSSQVLLKEGEVINSSIYSAMKSIIEPQQPHWDFQKPTAQIFVLLIEVNAHWVYLG